MSEDPGPTQLWDVPHRCGILGSSGLARSQKKKQSLKVDPKYWWTDRGSIPHGMSQLTISFISSLLDRRREEKFRLFECFLHRDWTQSTDNPSFGYSSFSIFVVWVESGLKVALLDNVHRSRMHQLNTAREASSSSSKHPRHPLAVVCLRSHDLPYSTTRCPLSCGLRYWRRIMMMMMIPGASSTCKVLSKIKSRHAASLQRSSHIMIYHDGSCLLQYTNIHISGAYVACYLWSCTW